MGAASLVVEQQQAERACPEFAVGHGYLLCRKRCREGQTEEQGGNRNMGDQATHGDSFFYENDSHHKVFHAVCK